MDKEAKDSKEAVTLDSIEDYVERKLKMNMNNRNDKSRMQSLFANYHSLLSQNGVSWIIEHVLSVIQRQTLRERLESDLSFSHDELKKDLKEFLKHVVKLSEAFQLVDSDPIKKTNKNDSIRSGNAEGT